MICPYCRKEGFITVASFDSSLFGCSECHSSYSEAYLQGWNMGFIEGQKVQPEDSADDKIYKGIKVFVPHGDGSGHFE